ncbi:hypothetical protein GEMRC1_012492 [Eukaryota sp. GEM-RC1]
MCKTYWNRDLNSSINIYSIIEAAIKGQARPSILERSKTLTTDFESGNVTLKRDRKKTAAKKTRKERECGECGQTGHDIRTCPQLDESNQGSPKTGSRKEKEEPQRRQSKEQDLP